jgi:hypothetical protein
MHMFLVLGIYLCQSGISFLGAVSADRVYTTIYSSSDITERMGDGTERERRLAMHTYIAKQQQKQDVPFCSTMFPHAS